MATTIITKYGSGAPTASDVVRGELAVDTENGRLYTETSGGAVIEIGLNPSGNVDVTGTVTADGLTVDGASAGTVTAATFTNTTSANGTRVQTVLQNVSSVCSVNLVSERVGANFGADFIVETSDTVDGTDRQRLRVAETGDISFYEDTGTTAKFFWDASAESLGIGTSSPSDALHVLDSSGNAYASIARGTQSQGEVGLRLRGGTSGNDWYVYQKTSSDNLNFYNTADRVTIDSSGNVGIGNDSPGVKLEVSNGSDSDLVMMIRGADNTTEYMALGVNGSNGVLTAGASGSESTNMVFRTASSGTEAEAMRIDSSGNVGIGQAPTAFANWKVLELKGGTAGAMLNFENSASTRVSTVAYDDSSDALRIQNFLANPITLETDNTERMRIDSSGNVGIGTSSPSDFDAAGDNLVVGTGSGNNGMTVFSGTANAGSLFFADGTGSAAAKADGYIQYTHSDQALAFATGGGSEAMRIDSSGRLLINATSETTPGNNSAYLIVESDAGSSQEGIYIRSDGGIGDPAFVVGDASNVAQLNIFGDGDVENTNGTYGTISDARVKENITDAASQWEDFKAIRIRRYNLISKPNEPHIGVIAQELEEAGIGGLVKDTRQDGMKSVKTSILYMKAIKALQEAMERIETLEAKVAQLEGAN